MALPRTQCITSDETALPVMQGAYFLCCAAWGGKVPEKVHGYREYRCTADSPHVIFPEITPLVFAYVSKSAFVVDSSAEDWLKFQDLADQWRNERGSRSSITETVMLPAYQKIIGMGVTAVPPILAQLRAEGEEPDQWFWALQAITEANPVNVEDQGNFQKMAKAWLQWAEQEAYAW